MLGDFLGELKNWYAGADYRVLFVISLAMLLTLSSFLYINKQRTGKWFSKGLDLKGGKELSIPASEIGKDIDTSGLEDYLSDSGIESTVRITSSTTGGELLVKVPGKVNNTVLLEKLNQRGVDTKTHSFYSSTPEVARSLLKQSQLALMVAFVFMAVVVLIVYRNFIPSIAIILAAFTDIVSTLAVMQILDIPLTLASFAGLLLVLGYSIDSDIVLTTRVLKRRRGSLSERTFSAMKTSFSMTFTTLSALVVLYVTTSAQALHDVATVLIIALLIDLVATWFGNASILRWWVER